MSLVAARSVGFVSPEQLVHCRGFSVICECWSKRPLPAGVSVRGIFCSPTAIAVYGGCHWALLDVEGETLSSGETEEAVLCAAFDSKQQLVLGTAGNSLVPSGVRCDERGMLLYSMSISHGLVMSGTAFGEALVWNPEDGGVRYRLKGHAGAVYCVRARDEHSFVTCGDDRSVRLYEGEQCVRVLYGFRSRVWQVSWLSGGGIAAVAEDSTVRVSLDTTQWDACVPTCIGWSTWSVAEMDGHIAVGSADSSVLRWTLEDLLLRHCDSSVRLGGLEFPAINCLALGPQGEAVVAANCKLYEYANNAWIELPVEGKVQAMRRTEEGVTHVLWNGPHGPLLCVSQDASLLVTRSLRLMPHDEPVLLAPCCVQKVGDSIYMGDSKGRVWRHGKDDTPIKIHPQRIIAIVELPNDLLCISCKDGGLAVTSLDLEVHRRERVAYTIEGGLLPPTGLVVRRSKTRISVAYLESHQGIVGTCEQASRKTAAWACRVVGDEVLLLYAVKKTVRMARFPLRAPQPIEHLNPGVPIWNAVHTAGNRWLTASEDGCVSEYTRGQCERMTRVLPGACRAVCYSAEHKLTFTADDTSLHCLGRGSVPRGSKPDTNRVMSMSCLDSLVAVADSMGFVSLYNIDLSVAREPMQLSHHCLNAVLLPLLACSSAGEICTETERIQPTKASLCALVRAKDGVHAFCAGEEPVIYHLHLAPLRVIRKVAVPHYGTITGLDLLHGQCISVCKAQRVVTGEKIVHTDVPEPTALSVGVDGAVLIVGMGGIGWLDKETLAI